MKPDIGSESRFLPIPPAFDTPIRRLPSEYRHPIWYRKSRMVWLPNGEKNLKISLFVLTECTNMTDTQTDGRTDAQTLHDGIGRACIASCGKNLELFLYSSSFHKHQRLDTQRNTGSTSVSCNLISYIIMYIVIL